MNLLDKIFELEDYEIIAPAVSLDGKINFQVVKSRNEVCLDYVNTFAPPKEFLFPKNELILVKEKDIYKEPILEDQKKLIFGIRACDLDGIKVFDFIFSDEKYYKIRKDNIIFIGLGCNKKAETCFCEQFEIDSNYSKVADLFLTHNLIIANTEQGKKIIEKLGLNYEDGKEKIAKPKSDKYKFSDEMFNNIKFFEKLGLSCIGCGICTFFCPTCHCFDIEDIISDNETKRYRIWDSCMFAHFTLHASGHNLRPTKKERIRQRFMHKFNYLVKNFGEIACTGCGRCITNCPVGIDIREIINKTTS